MGLGFAARAIVDFDAKRMQAISAQPGDRQVCLAFLRRETHRPGVFSIIDEYANTRWRVDGEAQQRGEWRARIGVLNDAGGNEKFGQFSLVGCQRL